MFSFKRICCQPPWHIHFHVKGVFDVFTFVLGDPHLFIQKPCPFIISCWSDNKTQPSAYHRYHPLMVVVMMLIMMMVMMKVTTVARAIMHTCLTRGQLTQKHTHRQEVQHTADGTLLRQKQARADGQGWSHLVQQQTSAGGAHALRHHHVFLVGSMILALTGWLTHRAAPGGDVQTTPQKIPSQVYETQEKVIQHEFHLAIKTQAVRTPSLKVGY